MEKKNVIKKSYYQDNKERLNKYAKKYYRDNPEKFIRYNKKYHDKRKLFKKLSDEEQQHALLELSTYILKEVLK